MVREVTTPGAAAVLIKEAWAKRYRGDWRGASEIIERLRYVRGRTTDLTPAHRRQVELLRISVLRADGELERAMAELDELRADIFSDPDDRAARFQYFLQRAINLHAGGDFSPALEFYLLADGQSSDPTERLICQMNALAILDSLNFPWDATLAKLRQLFAQAADSPLAGIARKHLQVFQCKRLLRRGDFAELFRQNPRLNETNAKMDQAQYLRLWADRLSYVDVRLEGREALLQRLILDESFHARSERLLTVTSDPRFRPASPKLRTKTSSERVDRLYLWTWRWLKEPTETHRANLEGELREFNFARALGRMTFEDYQMLRNALRWIAIFQKSLSSGISRYLDNFSIQDCEPFALFQFEGLWIDWLTAYLAGRTLTEIEDKIDRHPLARSSAILFSKLAPEWARSLTLVQSARRNPRGLAIDVEHNRIWKSRREITSAPLAQILVRLARQEVVSFEEALWIGFEIAPFDPEIHANKIHNAVARLKNLLPNGRQVFTKDQHIYWRGSRNSIHIVETEPRCRKLRLPPESIFGGSGAASRRRTFSRPVHPSGVLRRMNGQRAVTREELQEVLSLSKASATRWLEKWLQQGLIRRQGSGRSTLYHIETR